jgi:hypothetical protein
MCFLMVICFSLGSLELTNPILSAADRAGIDGVPKHDPQDFGGV